MVKQKPPSKSNSSDNPHRKRNVEHNGGQVRNKSTIERLNMYRSGRAIRNKKGKIIGGDFMMNNRSGNQTITATTGRIAPNRKWFGNTRVIGQQELDNFRDEMRTKAGDTYSVILRKRQLPMSLVKETTKVPKMHLLETESYEDVFDGKRRRKRPKLSDKITDYADLVSAATEKDEEYKKQGKDSNIEVHTDFKEMKRDLLFEKGQSKRIWQELYKVLDCSDVVIQVLDARDVPGTRCYHIEQYIRKHASHKHLIFVVNKCDMVPTWVTRKWVKILSAEYPTLAFHASITNSFGKGALINLLRQFGKLHESKQQISVGVIGYPNVGKSSIINTLKKKKVCKAAPIPGETKIWQYITLFKRIFLIDCPGVVYDTGDSEADIVLKGVVRAEKLPDPVEFVDAILARANPDHIQKIYNVREWKNSEDFLDKLCAAKGKLLAGGESDYRTVAVKMINDWQRGKIPHFVPPPKSDDDPKEQENDTNWFENTNKNFGMVADLEGKITEYDVPREPKDTNKTTDNGSDVGEDNHDEVDDDNDENDENVEDDEGDDDDDDEEEKDDDDEDDDNGAEEEENNSDKEDKNDSEENKNKNNLDWEDI